MVRIEGNGFVISGAHNVVVRGFISQTEQPYLIENSSDITLSGGYAQGLSLSAPSIEITGTSSNVTISRLAISARGPDNVQIDQGATGAIVTANTILASKGPAVAVTGAPGTDVVGNTLVTDCNPGVVVSGSSPGTSMENNIAETAKGSVTAPSACAKLGIVRRCHWPG